VTEPAPRAGTESELSGLPEINNQREDPEPEVGSAELVDEGKVERLASLVFARVENKLEQHLHTQMELPPAEQAAALREKAPEVYNAWVDIARQKAETEAYVQRAQYDVPAKLGRTGRPWALAALVAVLAFCAYVAHLGGAGVYVGGIIAAINLVSMLGLFLGFRPELTDRKEPDKHRLSDKQVEKEPSQEEI
jgi:hypothetical protein